VQVEQIDLSLPQTVHQSRQLETKIKPRYRGVSPYSGDAYRSVPFLNRFRVSETLPCHIATVPVQVVDAKHADFGAKLRLAASQRTYVGFYPADCRRIKLSQVANP
jgi:hypothetical protein